jgi:hypothetical protein
LIFVEATLLGIAAMKLDDDFIKNILKHFKTRSTVSGSGAF